MIGPVDCLQFDFNPFMPRAIPRFCDSVMIPGIKDGLFLSFLYPLGQNLHRMTESIFRYIKEILLKYFVFLSKGVEE